MTTICLLEVEVEYDEKITTPDDVAEALTILMTNANTGGVLEDQGNPRVGVFYPVEPS